MSVVDVSLKKKTGDPIVVSPGDEGGVLTNGVANVGTITNGDLDVWSFTANVGDGIVVRMGRLSGEQYFNPWVRLYGPDGALLDSDVGNTAAEVTNRAAISGTYTVVVG